MTDKSLINLGEISKPASILIEKISDAVGGIFKPYQIVRVAKAEAEAETIRAKAHIHIDDLQRRAMHRFLNEEASKQANMEGITQQALPLLEDTSQPQNIEDDWIANFFDKCRIVSNEAMQSLWSRVLAGEANKPGAFSKRTVNLLADLDKHDAELFVSLTRFCWKIEGDNIPLIFSINDDIYTNNGISFASLNNLESLGLIRLDSSELKASRLPDLVIYFYFNKGILLKFRADANHEIEIGNVIFTRAGSELAAICKATPIEGFFDYVCAKWHVKAHISQIDNS